MTNPELFYKSQLEKHQKSAKQFQQQLIKLSMLRLFLFSLIVLGVYFTYKEWQISLIIGAVGIIIFLFLLTKYVAIKSQRDLAKALADINKEELKIASGDFHERDQGSNFQNPNHFYSLDIDLFGKGSLFQFINRTTIKEGTQKLAKLLLANTITGIETRQKLIKELALKPEWRQQFSATTILIKVETPAAQLINWLKKHKSFLPKTIRWLPLIFGIISMALCVLAYFKIVDAYAAFFWLLLGLGITGKYLKKTNNLALNTDKIKDTFRQYALLLVAIENENFTSELLLEKQQKITSESRKASEIFSELSKSLDALDNRNNMISAILGNGFFLTDLKYSYKIEQWIKKHHHKVEDWFEVISFFEAYNSLGNYAFNHPEYVYPKITQNKPVINTSNLGHPLLDKNKRVDSGLEINNEEFFIVTGANMAGKSTFLRTVSLHIVMANVGLPVCATTSEYNPVKLITSMRTSDSLADDSSYFFSELKRLKFIVDEIAIEPYFIILDEILKGTNSTDKAIGSRKFVEKLVASNATGIIATHDLSLCEISKELDEVKNYFFDAQIINDELHFDYTLKKGICQNMNASFLLRKMEIV